MSLHSTDVRKNSTAANDLTAIRLLRRHGILSMAAHIAGLQTESLRSRMSALRQLLFYDPDLLNAMYATPHAWTPFAAETQAIVEPDLSRWDYRHQVLKTPDLRRGWLFALVKLTELCVQARPRQLWRLFSHPDRECRRALRWCFRNAARVWLEEIVDFLGRRRPNEGNQIGRRAF